jgi:hypothetical protein
MYNVCSIEALGGYLYFTGLKICRIYIVGWINKQRHILDVQVYSMVGHG